MADLIQDFQLQESALGNLTSAVQFGFIAGTLLFAFLSIADRFSPSRVFFACALAGAGFNLGVIYGGNGLTSLLVLRFMTGFCLAGIYPVGMKIAADHFEAGLGKSLGLLVGALVVGTSFPHFLTAFSSGLPWKFVLVFTSSIAAVGGLLMLVFVPDGPFRKASQRLELTALVQVFKHTSFRSAAFGYFGHMWELYAFWAFVPVILAGYQELHPETEFSVSVYSFLIIGLGGLACVLCGYLSQRLGTQRVAAWALALSGVCCLFSPLVILFASPPVLIGFLIFWGGVVVADSPLFSTLVAQHAPAEIKGTALTIVNCIGFSITIVSIQFTGLLIHQWNLLPFAFVGLALGPILGLWALLKKAKA